MKQNCYSILSICFASQELISAKTVSSLSSVTVVTLLKYNMTSFFRPMMLLPYKCCLTFVKIFFENDSIINRIWLDGLFIIAVSLFSIITTEFSGSFSMLCVISSLHDTSLNEFELHLYNNFEFSKWWKCFSVSKKLSNLHPCNFSP